jgi:hypothetical protein
VQERSQHIRVGAIADTPRMPSDPLDCLAEEPVDACAAPRDAALDAEAPFADAEQEARDHVGGAPVLDVNPILCGPEVCPVVLDGLPVYTDLDHLYSAFVLTLVPQVRTFVAQLMA